MTRRERKAARDEAKRHAPGELLNFAFQVEYRCPVNGEAYILNGPDQPSREEQQRVMQELQEKHVSEVYQRPQAQLVGYTYNLGDMTTESGTDVQVWHCAGCGGSHILNVG